MAGPVQRGSRGRGRSPRGASSSPAHAALSAAASGSTGRPAVARRTSKAAATRAADTLITGQTYRLLMMRGLAPDEAATLTAFLCGIPIAQVHWSIRQVNQLLFLRELARTGRFGSRDGETPRPH